MKFYIASRTSQKDAVVEIQNTIVGEGHESVHNWTNTILPKPLAGYKEEIGKLVSEDLQAVLDSDVFVMISDEAGTGMYAELGAALAKSVREGGIKIYIIGEHQDVSAFNFHPSVIWKSTFEDVLVDLGIA